MGVNLLKCDSIGTCGVVALSEVRFDPKNKPKGALNPACEYYLSLSYLRKCDGGGYHYSSGLRARIAVPQKSRPERAPCYFYLQFKNNEWVASSHNIVGYPIKCVFVDVDR